MNNETIEAFPLHWPMGYERTKHRIDSRFKITMDNAQRFLRSEINRLGGIHLIVSTNVPVRQDGGLYANWMSKKIEDPGVAIYFKYKGNDVAMCCDQYNRIWENVYALGKTIENLRGIERWGVSDFISRSFTGFTALPESVSEKNWWDILGVGRDTDVSTITKAYREKAKKCHPDVGGTQEQFTELQAAYEAALNN